MGGKRQSIEAFLKECLDSVISQTYKNIEVICVNDGSPDGCGDIIDSYVAKDSRFIHFKQDNGGICKARVSGENIAKGEYVYNLDGDDFIEPSTINNLLNKIIEEDSDLVYADYYDYTEGMALIKRKTNAHNLKTDNGIEYLESQISTFIWGKLMKKSLLYDLKIQSVNVNEDLFFLLQILPRCKKVSYLKENLYFYRHNLTSTMNGKLSIISKQWMIHSIEASKIIDYLPLTKKIKDKLLFDFIHSLYRYLRFGDKEKKLDTVKELRDIIYKRFPYSSVRNFYQLKLIVFIISSKLSIRTVQKLLRLKNR